MTHQDLLTMLILPEEEQRITEFLRARVSQDTQVEFAEASTDYSLLEQWAAEHPGSPVGDRRVKTLSVQGSDINPQALAEAVIDLITPHARGENARLKQGESVRVSADQIPWSAHYSLWSK